MPAHENNKVVLLEHPSGSKAEVALFGKSWQRVVVCVPAKATSFN